MVSLLSLTGKEQALDKHVAITLGHNQMKILSTIHVSACHANIIIFIN